MPRSSGAENCADSTKPFRYVDHGVERLAVPRTDCEAGSTIAVASSSSGSVKEYEDKLKAIELQRRGVEKSELAVKLGRSERWVQKWWKQEPKLLQRPHGAQDAVFQRVPLAGFRDLEFTKRFSQDSSLFDILAREVPWRRGKVMTRDQETGELVLRFDKRGSTIPSSRLVADCPKGIAALDALLQRAFSKANIRDPQARVVLNLYADGAQQLNSHRHDYWTCLVSLGAPRVLLVDNRPQVMEDGDMIVFGTQMHGVPPMPDVTAGRISLVVFFYPDRDNLERRWLTVLSDTKESDAADEEGACGELSFYDDCRTGSASSTAVPGASTLVALQAAVCSPESGRTRPHWRKTNAELQFMEYQKLPEVTIFSAGCGRLTDAELFRELMKHNIESIWDLRVGPEGALGRISRERLRQSCRGRLRYREWQMGTAAAGGLPHHLRTEEGATMVYRQMSEAQSARICFLGLHEEWRCDDLRMAVGAALIAAGSCVAHLRLDCLEGQQVDQQEMQRPQDELPARLQMCRMDRTLSVEEGACPDVDQAGFFSINVMSNDRATSEGSFDMRESVHAPTLVSGNNQDDSHDVYACSAEAANCERKRWDRRHAVACKAMIEGSVEDVVEGEIVSYSTQSCAATDCSVEFNSPSPSFGATERGRGRWGKFSRACA